MTDDVNLEKVQKELDDFQKTLKGMRKGLDSTTESLFKYTKSSKEHRDISDLLIQMKKKELGELGRKAGKDSTIYKTKSREIVQEISDIRRRGKEFGAFNQAVGVGRTAIVNFTRGLKANIVLGLVNLAKGVFKTGARFIDAEERIKSFSDVVKDFGDVPFLGKGLSALAKSADFNVGIFKQLAQTGATFESSIINLRNAAHDANMPILDFVDMVQKNSVVMAQLFGTVDAGVKRMGEFQKELRRTTQDQFAQFGLNLEETSEYFQTYLMLERARGRLALGTAQEEVEQSSKYIKNLITLSKLSGEEIDVIDKRNRELAANSVLQSQLLKLAPAQRDAINSAIASFGGADTQIGKLITQVAALSGATEKDTALLNQLAGGQIIPAIEALKSGAIGITEFRNIVGAAAQRGFLSDFNQGLARAAVATGEYAPIVNELGRLQKNVATSIANEMKARDTASAGFVSAKDSIDVFKAGAESMTTGTVDSMSKALGFLKQGIEKLGEDPRSKAMLKSGNITAGVLMSVFSSGSKALRITKDKAPEDSWWRRIFGSNASQRIANQAQYTPITDDEFSDLVDKVGGFQGGTKQVTGERFPNFGPRGTLVKVHGPEAIIPKESPMGKIVAAVDSLTVNPTVNAPATATSTVTGNNEEFTRISTLLNRSLDNISQIMDKSEKHLNTLVGINATVAKNTMDTKRGLANLSNSIV
jgi:hypothetical protein